MSFVSGVAALPRGARLAFGDRTLRRWVLMPFFLTLALLAVMGAAFIAYLSNVKGSHAQLAALVGMVAAVVGAYLAALLLSIAPFGGVMSRRAELLVSGGARADEHGFFMEALHGIGQAILILGLYLGVSFALLVAQAAVPVLAPLWVVAGLVQTALFVAYDFYDPLLSRRGRSFVEKWRYLGARRAEALGFGAATALLLAVPGVGLFVPPVAVVAATLLAVEAEARDQAAAVV
jgi:CysZ protein